MIEKYLEKSADPQWQEQAGIVTEKPDLIVVIPCFEEPDIGITLQSLMDCNDPLVHVLVIVVLNQSEEAGPTWTSANQDSKNQIVKKQSTGPNWLQTRLIEAKGLPKKKAGVGLARKIGMDLACSIFAIHAKPNAPIICLDADCQVAPNYFEAIWKHFLAFPDSPGSTIYFEHPLESRNSNYIALYELRLRYYVQALRWTGFPYAFQTVGSSMAVRADSYSKQGGMNQRKAGEDFYFLSKVIPLGNFSEIVSTSVYPSSRESYRVPFGTGRAIKDQLEGKTDLSEYYDLNSFRDLRSFFEQVVQIFDSNSMSKGEYQSFPPSIQTFLGFDAWQFKIEEIWKNGSTPKTRMKRFFSWFNAFQVLKFCHFSRDHYYPNSPLLENSLGLLEELGIDFENAGVKNTLKKYRDLEKNPWSPKSVL